VLPWLVAGGLVSAASIVLATRGIHLGEVVDAIESASPLPLVLGVLAILLSYPLLALRWRAVAADLHPPGSGRMLELVLIGTAVNNALPARLGEVARAAGLAQSARKPVMQSFGTVVVDRAADVLFFAIAFAVTFWASPSPGWVQWVGLGGSVITAVLVVLIAGTVLWMTRRRDAPPPASRVLRQLLKLADGLRCVRTWRAAGVVLALTAAAWGVWVLGAWSVARSIDITLTPSELLFVTALLGLGSAVPSAPGFIGTYHWIAASAVGLFGVGGAEGLAFAVLLHAAWFVPTTVVGSVLMVRWGLTFADLRRLSVTRQAVNA
jgi:uncharacterized protein (TIRG00374 family)